MRTRFERLVVAWRSLVQTAAAATIAYLVATEVVGHAAAVLRPGRRDHHARRHGRPAAAAGGRARARRRGRDRGRRRAGPAHRAGRGRARARRAAGDVDRRVPGQRPDLRHPGGGLGRADRGAAAAGRRVLGRALRRRARRRGRRAARQLAAAARRPAPARPPRRRAGARRARADARAHRPGDRVRRPGGGRARAAAGARPRRARGASARGGRREPRDRPLRARAPARPRRTSTSTPTPPPRSTSRSATSACSPAARCAGRGWGRTCRQPVAAAIRDLAEAVSKLREALIDPERADAVREPALRAAARATLVLQETGNLSVTVVVGQVRSTAVDLLRGSGLTYERGGRPRARGGRGGRGQRPAVSWTLRRAGAEDADAISETLAIGFDGYREFAAYGWQPPASRARRSSRACARGSQALLDVGDDRRGGRARRRPRRLLPAAGRAGQRPPVGAVRPPAVVGDRPRDRAAAARRSSGAIAQGYRRMRLYTPRDQARARALLRARGLQLHRLGGARGAAGAGARRVRARAARG